MITGHTRLAAVIGSPVRHSLSPIIHNAAFAAAQIDWAYVAFEVAPGNASEAVAAMRALHLSGMNVTMPHKADVAALCDTLSPVAALLGSVNTVVAHHGLGDSVLLHGESTDGDGFIDSLFDEDVVVEGKNCLVVGAGGAGRAVALALRNHGATVTIVNRTYANAQRAAHLVYCRCEPIEHISEMVRDSDIIVNASSVGMGHGVTHMPFDPSSVSDRHVIVDLIYHPARTELLTQAAHSGALVIGGLGMLIHQAARSFQLWTGVSASIEAMTKAAHYELDRRATA